MKSNVRVGLIGLGTIGRSHASLLADNQVPGLSLSAVVSRHPEHDRLWPEVRRFESTGELLGSGWVDAVVIATPHPDHPKTAAQALAAGLHVLVEKPIGVCVADARCFLTPGKPGQVVAAMFDARTNPAYRKIRELIRSGELGRIRRFNWTFSTCYRPEAYYRSADWRGTWKGEGGGLLLNQCAHHIDLIAWFFGLPRSVRGFCQFGRYHAIEVEDDVTAYFQYGDGLHGSFVASTGEVPGTNRLEITGDQGRLIFEDDRLSLRRNVMSVPEFLSGSSEGKADTVALKLDLAPPAHPNRHQEIFRNFAAAILSGEELISPAADGLASLELANALIFSTWTNASVELGRDAGEYRRRLQIQIQLSARAQSAAARP